MNQDVKIVKQSMEAGCKLVVWSQRCPLVGDDHVGWKTCLRCPWCDGFIVLYNETHGYSKCTFEEN